MIKSTISKLLCFLAILTVVFIFLYQTNQKPVTDNSSTAPIIQKQVGEWYPIAGSKNYRIFSSGGGNGNIVIVVDRVSNTLLSPDETCELPIPPDIKNKIPQSFYNDSVGIKVTGPYKSIFVKEGTLDTFTQKVQNAGCLSEEGTITLQKSHNPNQISCQINIKYKFLGC